MKQPWMKFWVTDWLGNPTLRMCSLEARALWVDMLCLMHSAPEPGHLYANGKPLTAADLARITGCSTAKVQKLLEELEPLYEIELEIIVNPQMVAAASKSQKCSEAGQRGASQKINRAPPQGVTLKGHPPGAIEGSPPTPPTNLPSGLEARGQRPEERGKEGARLTNTKDARPKPKSKSKRNTALEPENSSMIISDSDSRHESDLFTVRQKALNRWLMAVSSAWANRSQKGGQHAADRTVSEQLFYSHIWPSDSVSTAQGNKNTAQAIALIDRAHKNANIPMAWLTKRIQYLFPGTGTRQAASPPPASGNPAPLHTDNKTGLEAN